MQLAGRGTALGRKDMSLWIGKYLISWGFGRRTKMLMESTYTSAWSMQDFFNYI